MGKKIPGKKHRAIKDPYKQRQKRFESLRSKIDNPPINPDVQEIPKSLLKIVEMKNKAKETALIKPQLSKKRKRRRSMLLSVVKLLDKEPVQKGMTKPDKLIPNLVQKPNESTKSFLKRVNSMTQHMINEVEFEKKFGVEIIKNFETGEIVELKSLKKKNKKSKKKKLAEKRKAKLNEKKQNLKNIKDFSHLRDIVEFREVVDRPPELPKVQKKELQKQKFSNLLLNKVIKNTQAKHKNPNNDLGKYKKLCMDHKLRKHNS